MQWSKGNVKVACAVVNTGSGTDCPSASWCPFSRQNYKASGRPLCYAQKTEARFPAALAARRANAAEILAATKAGPDAVRALVEPVADAIVKWSAKKGLKYVRLNESGDLSADNVAFVIQLVEALRARGLRPYTYSKAPADIQEAVRKAGAVVLESESDFVCVRSAEEARAKRLTLCPGIGCGKSCVRCCKGLRSAVVAH